MSKEPSDHASEQQARIDLRRASDVRYWTNALACTRRELRSAVRIVGAVAADVRAYRKAATERRLLVD